MPYVYQNILVQGLGAPGEAHNHSNEGSCQANASWCSTPFPPVGTVSHATVQPIIYLSIPEGSVCPNSLYLYFGRKVPI